MTDTEIIWQILVQECGADDEIQYPDLGMSTTKASFIQQWPCGEFRFMGALGFGGKVRQPMSFAWKGNWQHIGQVYVDCYPEDESSERKAMIERANTRLAESVPWHAQAD
jgi:hypothetical protein